MTYIFEICVSYRIRSILAFFDSIIIFYVMGLFVHSTYVFEVYRRLPQKNSLTNSIQMIRNSNLSFYRDSETFASRFWRPICFIGWLQLGSNLSVFQVQSLISLVFLNTFNFLHFSNDWWVNNNWNAWLISSPACYWFDFNKTLRFTAGVTSEKLQSRPIMTKFDPTQPSHIMWLTCIRP